MPFTILNNCVISPLYLLYFNVGKFKAISPSLCGLLDSSGINLLALFWIRCSLSTSVSLFGLVFARHIHDLRWHLEVAVQLVGQLMCQCVPLCRVAILIINQLLLTLTTHLFEVTTHTNFLQMPTQGCDRAMQTQIRYVEVCGLYPRGDEG